MNEEYIDRIAQQTTRDILTHHAPDCLERRQLRNAIARLARQGVERSVRLYLMQHRQ